MPLIDVNKAQIIENFKVAQVPADFTITRTSIENLPVNIKKGQQVNLIISDGDLQKNGQDGQLSDYFLHIYGNQADMTNLPASYYTFRHRVISI